MKGVDRRQLFQSFCRSMLNPLWFKGSMDECMEFAFFLHVMMHRAFDNAVPRLLIAVLLLITNSIVFTTICHKANTSTQLKNIKSLVMLLSDNGTFISIRLVHKVHIAYSLSNPFVCKFYRQWFQIAASCSNRLLV
ncbi:hypothetical protein T08_955 [Trichinella sp. T8]|nr:hypothetical protein T08_955 [Trichinella sp. T8]